MTCLEPNTRRPESQGRAVFGRGGARRVQTTAVGALLLAVGTAAVRADTGSTTFVYPPWQHCYGLHRVTQTHLTLRAGFRYKFDDPEGLAAIKLAAEDDTTTTKDDDELTVFGVNSGQGMIIYNTSLTSLAFYGSEGNGPGEFRRPLGVAADRAGHVVVADTGNDRLHLLHYADDALHPDQIIAGEFAGRRLRRPSGVAIEGGEIYVCDPENARILVLGLEGQLQRVIAPQVDGRPFLVEPFGVAAIRARSDFNFFGEDFVAVTDSNRSRLVQLTPEGEVKAVRRVRELGTQARGFDYVAIDLYANVYCSDRSGRLHKFDRKLHTLLSFGRPGKGEYEFDEPRGLGLYRRFGQLFVAERAGAQYLWMGTDVFTPRLGELQLQPDGEWKGVARYFLTEYARVQLDLVRGDDAPVVSLQKPRWQNVGPVEVPVVFRAPEGSEPLRLRVEAIPTYSSRRSLVVLKTSAPVVLNATSAP